MKKLYFLALLLGICYQVQAVTVTIYASAAPGSYITGTSTTSARTDGNMVSGAGTSGWAVFDLSTIPAGSTVSSAVIGVYCSAYGGSGAASGWNTTGYSGDLSGIVSTTTLNTAITLSPTLATTSYGTGVGNQVIPTTAATQTFIEANAGGFASIGFNSGGTRIYTLIGESGGGGSSTTAANHVPYITIDYCPPPTGVTASAAPNPVCEGDNLILTGTESGSASYSWSGPGGYTSTLLSPTLTAGIASEGVYTLTAVAVCGTFSATAVATSAYVTVNPLPAAISGASSVCEGLAVTLSSSPSTGNWTSSDGAVATVGLTSGVVSGIAAGPVTITYTLGTGCYVTHAMTVNADPDVIAGPSAVCDNGSITLTNTVTGGLWSTTSSDISVGSLSGVVSGAAAGTATVTYTTGGCTPVTHDVTINPSPAPIGGPSQVCEGSTITLTETSTGGAWSSGSVTTALVGTSGVVTGVTAGTANIFYTFGATGCRTAQPVTVNALPSAITGPSTVCILENITLSDGTPGGTFSTLSSNAGVTAGGIVNGVTAGTAVITYTLGTTGCAITTIITVNPLPAGISVSGSLEFCEGSTVSLSDSDPGGAWSSSDVTLATVGTTGVVTGVAAGSPDITYTLATGCSAVVQVTVDPLPTSVITPLGSTTFCTGLSVVLDATAGGISYQWNNASGPIAGETNSSYTASASGSYTVDITNGFGCTGTSAAVVVTAGIAATIDYTTALNFCIGDSVTLTADAGGASGTISYQWMKDGVNIGGATLVSFRAGASGVYTASVTVSGGSGACTVVTSPVNVVVNNLPTPVISKSGGSLTVGSTYAVYQWFINSTAISGATNRTYVPYANGIYRVRVSDAVGCSGYSNAIQIAGVGVEMVTKDVISVFPNPAADVVFIEAQQPVRAVLAGLEGRIITDVNDAKSISISHLAQGIYILKLYDGSGELLEVKKIVKE